MGLGWVAPIWLVPTSPTLVRIVGIPPNRIREQRAGLAPALLYSLRFARLHGGNPWFPRVPPPCGRGRCSEVSGAARGVRTSGGSFRGEPPGGLSPPPAAGRCVSEHGSPTVGRATYTGFVGTDRPKVALRPRDYLRVSG